MRILLAHNFYQQGGGEDTVFRSAVALLRANGHTVIEYLDDNHRILQLNQASVALQTLWSRQSYKRILALLKRERPDVAHFFNTFPLISPYAYYACREEGVPVVQSLDNPRLLCPSANFYRDGRLCLDCFGKTPPWPSILHACYHESRLHTAVVASMLTLHRWLGTWQKMVDKYVVATHFYRDLFIKGGLPAEKLVVKPHFVQSDPGFNPPGIRGGYALYVARLDPAKGIRTMLKAWTKLNIPLKIRGGGQLKEETREFIRANHMEHVEVVGRLSEQELTSLVKNASFFVWPSEGYYETFGMAAVEAYASGVPVLASRIGVMTEIVRDGITGIHFNPGDADNLATKAQWLWDNSQELARMGMAARQEYELKYIPARCYEVFMDIYSSTVNAKIG